MSPFTLWIMPFDVPTGDHRMVRYSADQLGNVDLPVWVSGHTEVGRITGLFVERDLRLESWLRGIGSVNGALAPGHLWPIGAEIDNAESHYDYTKAVPLLVFTRFRLTGVMVYLGDQQPAWPTARLEAVRA